MADDASQSALDNLKAELSSLSSQVANMVKSFEKKNSPETNEMFDKISKELASLRALAGDRAHKVYEAGQSGMEEVGEHVRRNPLASLLIAFGAGCVISCIFRHLK